MYKFCKIAWVFDSRWDQYRDGTKITTLNKWDIRQWRYAQCKKISTNGYKQIDGLAAYGIPNANFP